VRRLLTHPTVRRFVKFALVGASATLIDMGVFWVLVRPLGWGTTWLMRAAANSISFTLGVTNGFLWNRYWTFPGAAAGHAPTQYLRFVLVNLIGLGVDTATVQLAFALGRDLLPPDGLPLAAKILAIPPVALWNFTAHSLWTFAPGREERRATRDGAPAGAEAGRREDEKR
jgi:putative flippase GtrA